MKTNNTPRMTSNEIYARVKENEFINAPTHRVNVIDGNGVIRLSRPCWGLDMAESIAADREGEIDGWTVEIVEQENRDEIQAYWDKENTEPTNPDNTPATMNANETTEFSELTHASQCLDIYLHNTADIYDRYTVPAIERVTRAIKVGEYVSDNAGQLAKDIQEITPAIQAAARLVKRYDHLTPTAKDIEQVTRNYAAYIVDCAKYELETAAK